MTLQRTLDIRAQQWVRAMTARPAGLTVDKEKVDTNLWNLLSGGRRDSPSQPIDELPVQPSPRKFKQQQKQIRDSNPWQTESSSTYVYYMTGDLALKPESPSALEQAELALQAEQIAQAALERKNEQAKESATAPKVPETNEVKNVKQNGKAKRRSKTKKNTRTKPKPVFKASDKEERRRRIAKANGMGYIRRKKTKKKPGT